MIDKARFIYLLQMNQEFTRIRKIDLKRQLIVSL